MDKMLDALISPQCQEIYFKQQDFFNQVCFKQLVAANSSACSCSFCLHYFLFFLFKFAFFFFILLILPLWPLILFCYSSFPRFYFFCSIDSRFIYLLLFTIVVIIFLIVCIDFLFFKLVHKRSWFWYDSWLSFPQAAASSQFRPSTRLMF